MHCGSKVSCGNSSNDGSFGNVPQHDRIRADHGMIADRDIADNDCARSNIHVSADARDVYTAVRAKRHVLEDHTVRTDRNPGMNHNSDWMGKYKSTADLRSEMYFAAADDGPEPMLKHDQTTHKQTRLSPCPPTCINTLIAP